MAMISGVGNSRGDAPGAAARTGFGAALRRFRLAAGLSQEALAERSGLSADAIAALERGRRTRPRAFTVGVLADSLALSADDRALLASAAAGSDSPAAAAGTPLPARLTSFVGRQQELAEVARQLSQTRLLTLFGPGGTGKTALAVAVAERQPGTCWFAALDACPEPALVVRAVASAVGVRERAGTPLGEVLRQHAAGLEGLLVLDNCEHVAAAAAELAGDLLRASTRLRVLATSREVLRVPGEVTRQVPVLPEADAVHLFADRAALASPGFAVAQEDTRAVARVCQLLDGVPLAIELAAARSRTLTPSQLAEGLSDAFTVLTSGPRTAAPRHQTMRAAVDWSYQLLEPDEQRLFRTLSVFAGGFDLAAAEAVWGSGVLGLLSALIDRSLVLAEPDGAAMRYRLLEVLRQYGQARLTENGEDDDAHRRHAEYYLKLAKAIPSGLPTGTNRRQWLPRCRTERANFDAALHWAGRWGEDKGSAGRWGESKGSAGRRGESKASAERRGESKASAERWGESKGSAERWDESEQSSGRQTAELYAELAHALSGFWTADGSLGEGRARLEAAIGAARGALRIRVLDAAAWFAYLLSDYPAAVAWMQESVDLKRATGDQRGLARRLNLLSHYRHVEGDAGAGRVLLGEALEIMTAHGHERGAAESSALAGVAAMGDGDLTTAERHLRAAIVVFRAVGDPFWQVIAGGCLCVIMLEKGNLAEARLLGEEVLPIIRDQLSGMREEASWLWGALLLAEAEGRDRTALRLLGAIEVWAQRGTLLFRPVRERFELVADRLRERAGPETAAALMAEGAAIDLDELIAQALATEDG
jgi:predicted ATPase/DNA-binding XRE family transcriptional regulator